jgi:hypothetical protein
MGNFLIKTNEKSKGTPFIAGVRDSIICTMGAKSLHVHHYFTLRDTTCTRQVGGMFGHGTVGRMTR